MNKNTKRHKRELAKAGLNTFQPRKSKKPKVAAKGSRR